MVFKLSVKIFLYFGATRFSSANSRNTGYNCVQEDKDLRYAYYSIRFSEGFIKDFFTWRKNNLIFVCASLKMNFIWQLFIDIRVLQYRTTDRFSLQFPLTDQHQK